MSVDNLVLIIIWASVPFFAGACFGVWIGNKNTCRFIVDNKERAIADLSNKHLNNDEIEKRLNNY
ncbi:MAG: hypothetical protein HWN81_00530 [Candidatus Lokiarchaeota archaeon]|nr:hypothetical protein [Candidatus Lokiarchaeota archaeon]